jgi:hypothetical protein
MAAKPLRTAGLSAETEAENGDIRLGIEDSSSDLKS